MIPDSSFIMSQYSIAEVILNLHETSSVISDLLAGVCLNYALTGCFNCYLLFDSLFLLFMQVRNSRMTITISKTRIARAAKPPPTKMRTLLFELFGASVEAPIYIIRDPDGSINYS